MLRPAIAVPFLLALGALAATSTTQEPRARAEVEGIRLFELRSDLLSEFWGRDITMQAGVVLPPGHADRQDWPVCYDIHGFGGDHGAAWRRGPELRGNMANGSLDGEPYPKMLYVFLNARCPLGHHEFADSVNNGPWGQALITELIPALEAGFGADGTPAGRFVTGHSSGGWSSLWLQITYPDFFGGSWSTAPDPVDFRDFTHINVYDDENAYFDENGDERPLVRRRGEWVMSIKEFADREFARRSHGGQLASFDAVFSPRGEDGTPMHLFDRATGLIDRAVAKSWERYDIRLILRRNWAELGPKIAGKVHIYCGLQDTFGLEGACLLLQEELGELGSDAEFVFVEDRDHMNLHRPHTEWPAGMMARIHREMAERFRGARR